MAEKEKKSVKIVRNFHKLAILKREANGKTSSVPSKKVYKRNPKHKERY